MKTKQTTTKHKVPAFTEHVFQRENKQKPDSVKADERYEEKITWDKEDKE